MLRRTLHLCTAAILFLTAPLAAEEITVYGTKQTPSSVDVIKVRDEDRQVKTLGELLESRVGVQVTRYGSAGSYSSVYVRGANANQLAVYIDGMPLSDSVFGETNFENIPIDSLERIEIYRSFAPLRFRTQGIGGVINLVTKKKGGASGISASAGSFGTGRVSLFGNADSDGHSLLLTGSLAGSEGDFPFINNNGTKFNASDDFTDRRKNNGFGSANATARYSYDGGFSADALSDLFVKRQGLASYGNTASHTFLETIRSLNSAALGFGDRRSMREEISCFLNVRRDTFDDSRKEIGLLAGRSVGTDLSFGAGSDFSAALPFQEFEFTASVQNEYYYLTKTSTSTRHYPAQSRFSACAGLEDSLILFDRRFVLTPRLRAAFRRDAFSSDTERSDTTGSVDPQAGALLWLIKGTLCAKGSCGMTRRAPTFAELFGDRGSVRGNAALRDERSKTADAGLSLSVDGIDSAVIQSFGVDYTVFRTKIRSVILFIQDSQYTMHAENISAASVTGHELTARAAILSHAELTGNLTLQRARDESGIAYYKGNYLPHRPILEGSAAVKLFCRLGSITWDFSYTGGNFRDRANSEPLYIRQRVCHTVTAVWTPRWDITVAAEMRNAADSRTQDVAGYPLPGRSFTGSVKYLF